MKDNEPVDNLNIKLTHHAREVMKDREITFDEIAEIIARPEIVETHDGKRRYVGKGLAVVVADDRYVEGGKVVITILLRQQHQWDNDEAKGRKR